MKLVGIYHRKNHCDDCFTNDGEINFKTIEEKNKFQKFELQKNFIKDKMTGKLKKKLKLK